MYNQIHQIAQAEFALRNAKRTQRTVEGMTVAVPNVFDRLLAALRGTPGAARQAHPNSRAQQRRAAHGVVAK